MRFARKTHLLSYNRRSSRLESPKDALGLVARGAGREDNEAQHQISAVNKWNALLLGDAKSASRRHLTQPRVAHRPTSLSADAPARLWQLSGVTFVYQRSAGQLAQFSTPRSKGWSGLSETHATEQEHSNSFLFWSIWPISISCFVVFSIALTVRHILFRFQTSRCP